MDALSLSDNKKKGRGIDEFVTIFLLLGLKFKFSSFGNEYVRNENDYLSFKI